MKEVNINIAFSKKYPERVVLVTCCDKFLKPNAITLGWCMQTSFQPPLIAISIGLTRYSYKLIAETKEFVVCFPSENMTKEVLYCGTHSGRDVNKFEKTKLKTKSAKLIKPPLLQDCVINLECKLVQELKTGDHAIFVGEILTSYVSEKENKILLNFGDYKFGTIK